MTDPRIHTVFNSFLLLLEGDKAILGEIELISIARIQQWVSPKSAEIPIEVRSMIAYNLTDKAAYIDYLKHLLDNQILTQDIYRCTVAMLFDKIQAQICKTGKYLDDESWVRYFVYLFRLSQKLPEQHIDHEIMIHNSSQELLAHFEDDFELMAYEGARLRAQLSGVHNTFKIYAEFKIHNWQFFPILNQLVDARLACIRRVNKDTGRISYQSPQHYLFS